MLHSFNSRREEIITYAIAIVAVNAVCLYLRSVEPTAAGKHTVLLFHVFFGTMQLITLVPKMIGSKHRDYKS